MSEREFTDQHPMTFKKKGFQGRDWSDPAFRADLAKANKGACLPLDAYDPDTLEHVAHFESRAAAQRWLQEQMPDTPYGTVMAYVVAGLKRDRHGMKRIYGGYVWNDSRDPAPTKNEVFTAEETEQMIADKKAMHGYQAITAYTLNSTHEERSERAKRAAATRNENRLQAKTFKQALNWYLDMSVRSGVNPDVDAILQKFEGRISNREAMAIALAMKAIREGDPKAFATVRDTTGELPVQEINLKNQEPIKITIETVD